MIGSKPLPAYQPGATLGRLFQQTHAIHEAVVESLVGQGHRHILDKCRHLEHALFGPISRMPDSAAQEKGHQLQAWMHSSRIDEALAALDQESRKHFAVQPDDKTSLHALQQRYEQLAARVERRDALLDRRAAWAAAIAPPSCELDPITVAVLPPAPLSNQLGGHTLEQAVKHINALEKEIALLDNHIRQEPQPLSHAEEEIFLRQRNAMTESRNAWATGRLKGSSQFKSSLGLVPERKRLEQSLERHRQLAPVELTLHRLERTVETVQRNGLGEKLSAQAVDAARDVLVNLREAWRNGKLDGSSIEGMNPALLLTPPNNRRIKLELAVIEKAFVQLDAVPRTEQAGIAEERAQFKAVIDSANSMHVKHAAISQLKERNKQRALVAELNTDLRTIYTDLKSTLALHRLTATQP
jgi:hypothetical protein